MTHGDRAPSHVWLIELPAGWVELPRGDRPDPLAPHVEATSADARPAAAIVADLLRVDRDAGAVATAWSTMTVGGSRLVAGHSVLTGLDGPSLLDDLDPATDAVLASGQPVELPRGTAVLDVVLRHRGGVPLLEVCHTIEAPGAGAVFRLIGRSPHVALADQVVRMFHLMAATFEVVTDSPQPEVVRE